MIRSRDAAAFPSYRSFAETPCDDLSQRRFRWHFSHSHYAFRSNITAHGSSHPLRSQRAPPPTGLLPWLSESLGRICGTINQLVGQPSSVPRPFSDRSPGEGLCVCAIVPPRQPSVAPRANPSALQDEHAAGTGVRYTVTMEMTGHKTLAMSTRHSSVDLSSAQEAVSKFASF